MDGSPRSRDPSGLGHVDTMNISCLCLLKVELLSAPVTSLIVPTHLGVGLLTVPVGHLAVRLHGLGQSDLLLEGLD